MNGWNPPVPASSAARTNQGQRLLGLVRILEKKDTDDASDIGAQATSRSSQLDEAIDLLNNLIHICSRWGILEGDQERAQGILSTTSSSTRDSANKNNKRGSKKGMNNGDLNLHGGPDDSLMSNSGSGAVKDEELVLSAILRILGNGSNGDNCSLLLVQGASELLVAMSERIKNSPTGVSDDCSLAEYELLAQNGKQILTFLAKLLNGMHDNIRAQSPSKTGSCIAGVALDETSHVSPLVSCLKATISLISLFGTKLSRSPSLLADLRGVSWGLVASSDENVQLYASRLVAVIPHAGGTDRKTPSDLWTTLLSDIVLSIPQMLDVMAPLTKTSSNNIATLSNHMEAILQSWTNFVQQDISSEEDRATTFSRILSGLCSCFQAMFDMQAMGPQKSSQTSAFLEAKVDIDQVLNIVERFLSFPLSAESIFYRTKKRLRGEAVDGGLLSPSVLASTIASKLKCLGHDILECLMSSIDGQVLLPFSRRIIRMSYAAILTSCSGSLRKVMDPSNAVQLDGKKRRWLQTSVALRIRSIESFREVALVFGSDKKGASTHSSGNSSHDSSDLDQALALICGCIVEQVSWKVPSGDVDSDWGSFNERCLLVSTGMDTLAAVLSGTGGIISISARALVDSVAISVMRNCQSSGGSLVLECSHVHRAILNLGGACVSNPWPDGSSSSVTDDVASLARFLEDDSDVDVVALAKMTSNLCDVQNTPRAPPIIFVSRSVAVASPRNPLENMSASTIASRLDAVNEEQRKFEQIRVQNEKKARDDKELASSAKKRKTEPKPLPKKKTKEEIKAETSKADVVSKSTSARDEDDGQSKSPEEPLLEKIADTNDANSSGDVVMEVPLPVEVKVSKAEEIQKHKAAATPEISAEMNLGSDDEMMFPGIVADGPDSDDE